MVRKVFPPIVLLPALIVFVTILCKPFGFDDYFYYVKSGEFLWQTGHVLSKNYFSFTAPDFLWINHAWGSGFLFFLVHQLLGDFGIHLLNASGFLLSAWIFHRTLKSHVKQPSLLFLFNLGFSLLLGIVYSAVRPWLFGNLLFLLQVVLLHDSLGERLQERRKRLITDRSVLVFLVLSQVLWVNLHGSFPVGIFLSSLILWARKNRGARFWVSFVFILLTSLVSPYGWEGAILPLKFVFKFAHHMGSPIASITEWQYLLAFQNTYDWLNFFILLLVLAAITSSLRKAIVERNLTPDQSIRVVFLAASVALVLQASRNFYFFYVGNLILFSKEISLSYQKFRDYALSSLKNWELGHWEESRYHWLIIPMIAIVSVTSVEGFGEWGYDPVFWPPGLLREIKRDAQSGNQFGDRIFWDFEFSDIPIYRTDLGKKVFYDSREYCYPPEVYQSVDALAHADLEGVIQFAARWSISSFVIKKGSALDLQFARWRDSPRLKTLYEDGYSKVVSLLHDREGRSLP